MQSSHAQTDLKIDDCSELEQLSNSVGWSAEYLQTQCGTLAGGFSLGLSENLRIGNPKVNRRMVGKGTPPKDCTALIMPVRSNEPGFFQGIPFGTGQAALAVPRSEIYYQMPENTSFLTVSIPSDRLRPVVEDGLECSLDPLIANTRVLSMSDADVLQMQQFIEQVLSIEDAENENLLDKEHALTELEQHIVAIVAMAITSPTPKSPRRIDQRLRIFQRARDYVAANLASPLGIEVLAKQTGVSLRTLRYSFQQVIGINPLRYVRLRRLGAARLALQASKIENTTVTQIATRCGFSHMSYFSRDYREFFGETPVQTLRST